MPHEYRWCNDMQVKVGNVIPYQLSIREAGNYYDGGDSFINLI